MPIDGVFVHYLTIELNEFLSNSKIEKIYQPSKNELIFQVRKDSTNKNLYINFGIDNPRIHFTNKKYDNPPVPYNICMILRKYIERGIIKNISQIDNDRIICLTINSYNDMDDSESFRLYFELTGRSSNLVLTDNNNIIIDSSRKIGPDETNSRLIIPHSEYKTPIQEKLNPFNCDRLLLVESLQGISKQLEEEIKHSNSFFDVINRPIKPVAYYKSKPQFYIFPLNYIMEEYQEYNCISDLLDDYFSKTKTELNESASFLKKHIQREINKRTKKISYCLDDLEKDKEIIKNKNLAILLQSNIYLVRDKDKEITINDYFNNNEPITIKLNPDISPSKNLSNMFKSIKKAENGVIQITNQIEIAKSEISYLENILYQVPFLSHSEIEQVKQELINNKMYLSKGKKNNIKNKVQIPYIIHDKVNILFGKNNIQNNILTNKIAKKDYYWFHAKDIPGSHVVVESTELNEELIRLAANIAAAYSKGSTSSSVPVDYVLVKYLKKIPGTLGCNVTFTNNKTIYIDPNMNELNKYKIYYKNVK